MNPIAPPPSPYSGAFDALTSEAETYDGRVQVDDIIGLGQPGDAVDCEAEYSAGAGLPLSAFSAEMGGMAPMPQGPQDAQDPMANDQLRGDLQDLLSQRAQARSQASARFQDKVAQMNKTNIGGSGY